MLEAERESWHILQGRALIGDCHLGHQDDLVRRQLVFCAEFADEFRTFILSWVARFSCRNDKEP